MSRRTSYSDLTRRDGKFSMEDKIEWIERIIDSKIMIPKVYGNFGELLLLPYSVLQKLIDYNESADYGVNKWMICKVFIVFCYSWSFFKKKVNKFIKQIHIYKMQKIYCGKSKTKKKDDDNSFIKEVTKYE